MRRSTVLRWYNPDLLWGTSFNVKKCIKATHAMTSFDNRYNQHTSSTSPEKDRSADVMFCLLLRLFCFRPMSYFVCNSDSFVSQSSVSWCDGWKTLQRELIFHAHLFVQCGWNENHFVCFDVLVVHIYVHI